MSPAVQTNLVRSCGLATVLGGVIWAINAVFYEGSANPDNLINNLLFLAPLLFIAGLVGFYFRYADAMQGAGSGGFVQTFAGLGLLTGGFIAGDLFGFEEAARVLSFGFIIVTLGLVLFGFAFLKMEPLPHSNFLPLALGIALPASIIFGNIEVLRIVVSVLFGLGWSLFGAVLFSDAEGPGGDTSRAK